MGIYANIFDSARGRDALSILPKMADQVLVLNAAGPFDRRAGEPAVVIESHMPGIVRAVPVDQDGKPIAGTMKGYSFIASSDSRFSELVEGLTGARFYGAVALHDRKEG